MRERCLSGARVPSGDRGQGRAGATESRAEARARERKKRARRERERKKGTGRDWGEGEGEKTAERRERGLKIANRMNVGRMGQKNTDAITRGGGTGGGRENMKKRGNRVWRRGARGWGGRAAWAG